MDDERGNTRRRPAELSLRGHVQHGGKLLAVRDFRGPVVELSQEFAAAAARARHILVRNSGCAALSRRVLSKMSKKLL